MYKVQNKNIAAFKKLVLEIAFTLQLHKSSKYLNFQIKPSERRLFVNMALKHFTKAGSSQLSVSGDCPAHHKVPPAVLSGFAAGGHPAVLTGLHALSTAAPGGTRPEFLVPVPPASPGFYLALYCHQVLL